MAPKRARAVRTSTAAGEKNVVFQGRETKRRKGAQSAPGESPPAFLRGLGGKPLPGGYRVPAELPMLGAGASGCVVKVLNALDEPKAAKFLRPEYAERPEVRRRFDGEVKKLSAVRHPNIIRVEYVDEVVNNGKSLPFYVMEYVDRLAGAANSQIDTWARAKEKQNKFLHAREVNGLIREIILALKLVHRTKLYHLDLKPANVLVTPDGYPKLSDFGLARAAAESRGQVASADSRLRGREPSAMHPEMLLKLGHPVRDADLKPQFDLFGIGYTLEQVSGFLKRGLDSQQQHIYDLVVLRLTAAQTQHHLFPSRARLSRAELRLPEFTSCDDVLAVLDVLDNPKHHMVAVPELRLGEESLPAVRIGGEAHAPTSARMRSIIDTRAFQRLRWMKQLDLVDAAYPGAVHSRAEHGIGSYYYAIRYIRQLLEYPYFLVTVSAGDVRATLLAALLHDIGHYPMAHALKESVSLELESHEGIGQRILRGEEQDVLNGDEQAELRDAIQKHWNVAPDLVAKLAFGVEDGEEAASAEGPLRRSTLRLLHSIVDGPLDCDKMHYLLCDSLHSGNPVGRQFDAEQLISALTLNENLDGLAVTEKGLAAAESYVYARYRMHIDVYWHHTVRGIRKMVARAIDHHVGAATGDEKHVRARRVQREACVRTDRDFLESLYSLVMSTGGARSLLGGIITEERRLDGQSTGVFRPRRAIHRRRRTFFEDSQDVGRTRLFRALRAVRGAALLKLEGAVAMELGAALGIEVEPWEVMIDVPPSDEAEVDAEPIVVRYRAEVGQAEWRFRDLSVVSSVAREIVDDFRRNASKIRVFLSDRVCCRLLAVERDRRRVVLNTIIERAVSKVKASAGAVTATRVETRKRAGRTVGRPTTIGRSGRRKSSRSNMS